MMSLSNETDYSWLMKRLIHLLSMVKAITIQALNKKEKSEMASEISQKKKFQPYTEEQKKRIHELLQSWQNCSDEEAREQQETFEYLKKALDEDRLSQRKLFP